MAVPGTDVGPSTTVLARMDQSRRSQAPVGFRDTSCSWLSNCSNNEMARWYQTWVLARWFLTVP